MTISFILNGEDIIHSAESHQSLLSVLQNHFTLVQNQTPCQKTYCQRCMVLLDNKLMLACQIPFFMVRRREVITLEGWKQTAEYQSLRTYLESQRIETCPSCTDIRLFTYYSSLEAQYPLDSHGVQNLVEDIPCRCGTIEKVAEALKNYSEQREAPYLGKK